MTSRQSPRPNQVPTGSPCIVFAGQTGPGKTVLMADLMQRTAQQDQASRLVTLEDVAEFPIPKEKL